MSSKLSSKALIAVATTLLSGTSYFALADAPSTANPSVSNQLNQVHGSSASSNSSKGEEMRTVPGVSPHIYGNRTTQTSTSGITYHGGPVMTSDVNKIYIIWYGSWNGNGSSNSQAQNIIRSSIAGLNGSAYFNINTTYYSTSSSGVKTYLKNQLAIGSETTVAYTYNKALTDASIASTVSDAITSTALPVDVNGIYLVLTSYDVTETSGFLSKYCGWHTYGTTISSGTSIKYSFVGDPSANLTACAAQTISPNGNAAADAMVSVIAHEIEETVTDPQLNAWYDTRGYENGDKCAWKFGTTSKLSNGAQYNMLLPAISGPKYLVQMNWVNTGSGGCQLGI